MAVKFPTESEFWAWAKKIPVQSRDKGFGPIEPWGTQTTLVREILKGLNEGCHQFLVHKSGQIGASRAMSYIATYWMQHYDGLQGVMVANADDVREFWRDEIVEMSKVNCAEPPRLNNKSMLALTNGSKMMFNTAGLRSGSRVSVGRGFAFGWGTEAALWQNPMAMTILRTRWSDVHPQRLLVFESTPRGTNWWKDVYDESEEARDIRRIELFWWLREDNALEMYSDAFKHYWDGRLTGLERKWVREVKKRYRADLTPMQLAWRRQYVAEKAGGDEKAADQEMATLTEEGFEATGISFLQEQAELKVRRSVRNAPTPQRYRYVFGARFEESDVKKTIAGYDTLLVWEKPKPVQGYVVSCVPAFSTTATCPDNVISVWKASRDDLEQVAEFCDEDCGQQAVSWVAYHLNRAYATARRAFILEIQGFGEGVLIEWQRLLDSSFGTRLKLGMDDLGGTPYSYTWRRPDSMGSGFAKQWKTSPQNRGWALSRLREQIANGVVIIRSEECQREMEHIRQDGDSFKPEGKRAADHRAMAAALAVESWAKQLRPLFLRVQGGSRASDVTGRMLEEFFDTLSKKAQATRR